jgi:ornithine decarboxylase
METARAAGLIPSGLSVHVGSQQMTADAWRNAFKDLTGVVRILHGRGIVLDHVNLGGGLPALGYLDKRGRPLNPPMNDIFAAMRAGMNQLRRAAGAHLTFVLEPGRHLVGDHGAIRAHVARLTYRQLRNGAREHWLYLSCGKFNGLYESDQLRYSLEFPSHDGGELVPAVVAGPTCDSDDRFGTDYRVRVPKALASGDPVWIRSCGAYATSYMTQGFNGFGPLPHTVLRGDMLTAGASAAMGSQR